MSAGVAEFKNPIRIQRKRTRGWRMPPNTVIVTRGTPWGNPFIVNPHCKPGSKSGACFICVPTVQDAVDCFEEMLSLDTPGMIQYRADIKAQLRGKNLACFCKLDSPCHADILLRVANEEDQNGSGRRSSRTTAQRYPKCRSSIAQNRTE